MLEEQGLVIKVEGEIATVKVKRKSACQGCVTKGLCQSFNKEELLVQADNPIGAQEGQKVKLGLETKIFLQLSFIFYCCPLLGLIIGAVLGEIIFHKDCFSFMGGMLGLAAGYILVKYVLKERLERDKRTRPSIKEFV